MEEKSGKNLSIALDPDQVLLEITKHMNGSDAYPSSSGHIHVHKPGDHLQNISSKALILTDFKNVAEPAFKSLDNRSRDLLSKKSPCTPAKNDQVKNNLVSLLDSQCFETEKQMDDLIEMGQELISNPIADEQARNFRSLLENRESRKSLFEELDKKSIRHKALFNEMKSKWTELDHQVGPKKLFQDIEIVKRHFEDVLDEKNELLDKSQRELDKWLGKCNLDAIHQEKVVKSFSERVGILLQVQKKARKAHLDMLESSLWEEFESLIENERKYLELRMKDLKKNDEMRRETIGKNRDKMSTCLVSLEKLGEELTRSFEKRMNDSCDELERDMISVKYDAKKIVEAMDVNAVTMKCLLPEEEILLSCKRHRITNIFNEISKLRHTLIKKQKHFESLIQKKKNKVVDVHRKLSLIKSKRHGEERADHERFRRIWNVHQKDAIQILNKVLEIDCFLTEFCLGNTWNPPNLENIYRVLPTLEKIPKCRQKSRSSGKKSTGVDMVKSNSILEKRLGRNFMRMLANLTKDLSHQQTQNLLGDGELKLKGVVRLNDFLSLLQITDIKEVESLTEYFRPYALNAQQQQVCHKGLKGKQRKENEDMALKPHMMFLAVNKFIEDRENALKNERECLGKVVNISNYPSLQEIRDYWQQFYDVLPKNQMHLYYFIGKGLEMYGRALRKREKLTKQCSALRKQNEELKRLLKEYI